MSHPTTTKTLQIQGVCSSFTQQRREPLRRPPTASLENVAEFMSSVVYAIWRHTPRCVSLLEFHIFINGQLSLQEELISETFVIFVVATTGSGTEPRGMTPLWNMLLRSDLPDDLFEDMDFCMFGLGDSAYERFCWPAKKLSRRLLGLGAREICSRGEGDDQHPLGYVFCAFIRLPKVLKIH